LLAPVRAWPTGFSPAFSGTVGTPLDFAPELPPALPLELPEPPPLLPHAATASVNIPVTAIVVTPRLHLIGVSLSFLVDAASSATRYRRRAS
jgi:hypothetical protein